MKCKYNLSNHTFIHSHIVKVDFKSCRSCSRNRTATSWCNSTDPGSRSAFGSRWCNIRRNAPSIDRSKFTQASGWITPVIPRAWGVVMPHDSSQGPCSAPIWLRIGYLPWSQRCHFELCCETYANRPDLTKSDTGACCNK